MFGVVQVVRAVGAVCGGFSGWGELGRWGAFQQERDEKDKLNMLYEILHIPFQPLTSLPQTPQHVLSCRHPFRSVHLSQCCVTGRMQETWGKYFLHSMRFQTRMSNLDPSDHRTLFHFETVNFKWSLAHRT